jgi:hypothetical protein
MTTKRLFVAVLLVALALGPAATASAAAATSHSADLAVRQPAYVDGDVKTVSTNETTVYRVAGERIELAPQNFDASNVVDFGVATDGGNATLSYDREFESFTFAADETGTYDLYWLVERPVSVANESDNGTHIELRERRYTAAVRVTGQTAMVHRPSGWAAEYEEDAERWQEYNSSVVQPLRDRTANSLFGTLGLSSKPSTEKVLQDMATAYLTFEAPLSMLSGNFTQIVMLVGMTLGGWLFVATVIIPLLVALGYAYLKLNRHETREAQEGTLMQRVADLDLREAKRKLANWSFNDVTDDDYYAEAMRDEGRNPLQAIPNRETKLSGQKVFHAITQAMAQCGYVAVVDERAPGEDDDDGRIVDAHVAREDAVDDDAEVVSLEVDTPDADLLQALDPEQDEIYEFDLLNADFDRADVNHTPLGAYDLNDLVETTQMDLRRFGDVETAAHYHLKFLRDVMEHPITNDRGSVDSLRYWVEQNYDTARLIDDRFPIPMTYRARLWEAVIDKYDAAAEAEEALQSVQEGANA